MKPIIIGHYKIVQRPDAWAFISHHPTFSIWLGIASLTAAALLIRVLLRAEYKATHPKRTPNKHHTLTELEKTLKNCEPHNR